MCGIAGIIHLDNERTTLLPHVHAMCKAMDHRGPDGDGYLAADTENNRFTVYGSERTPEHYFRTEGLPYLPKEQISAHYDERVSFAFGHRRLSILDLSANGHQPQCDSEQRYWLISTERFTTSRKCGKS